MKIRSRPIKSGRNTRQISVSSTTVMLIEGYEGQMLRSVHGVL
jgi:hypothetical protein